MSETVTLVKPLIPVGYVADFFGECGVEILGDLLRDGEGGPAVETLFFAIQWAADLKREADQYGGLVTPKSNETAVYRLLEGWDALRTLGALD